MMRIYLIIIRTNPKTPILLMMNLSIFMIMILRTTLQSWKQTNNFITHFGMTQYMTNSWMRKPVKLSKDGNKLEKTLH